jgi:hypothetical protein
MHAVIGDYRDQMSSERERLLEIYRERVAGYPDPGDEFGERWRSWCRMVLAHGGDLVVPPMHPEPDLDDLLAGATLHGPRVEVLDQGGDCHANVAKLWIEGGVDAVGTGYALTEGLWRQHSWGVAHDGAVLETKWLAERYFGVRLAPGEPTVKFAVTNYPDDVQQVLDAGTGRAAEIIRVLREVRGRRTRRDG